MVVHHEKVHNYSECPKCKQLVSQRHRFCRNCHFWLARPAEVSIRRIHETRVTPSRGDRFRDFSRKLQGSLHLLLVGGFLGAGLSIMIVMYIRYLSPQWLNFGPHAQQGACYANMRVIQGAMEAYLTAHRFTPALASEPVKVLFDSGFLTNQPKCPLEGNRYFIPPYSSLQCKGPSGHGKPE